MVIILVSCKGVEDITMTGVSDFHFKGMENEKIYFSALVGVHNPSAAGFKVSELNVKVTADGMYIGALTTSDKVKVHAKSDTTYLMNFTLTLANALTGATSLYSLSRKKEVKVELQGYIKARSWLTMHKEEIKESRVVQVPALNK
jgi:LEA14-like dessication related protein